MTTRKTNRNRKPVMEYVLAFHDQSLVDLVNQLAAHARGDIGCTLVSTRDTAAAVFAHDEVVSLSLIHI